MNDLNQLKIRLRRDPNFRATCKAFGLNSQEIGCVAGLVERDGVVERHLASFLLSCYIQLDLAQYRAA